MLSFTEKKPSFWQKLGSEKKKCSKAEALDGKKSSKLKRWTEKTHPKLKLWTPIFQRFSFLSI